MGDFLDWLWQPSDPFHARSMAATFVLAAFSTWLAILYARSRKLFDLPGQRRSHLVATPRGGGIAIVIGVLFAIALVHRIHDPDLLEPEWLAIETVPIILVAGIGWLDDHRSIKAIWRLLVHVLAVAIALWGVLIYAIAWPAAFGDKLTHIPLLNTFLVLLIGVAFVWSINLHNFMDGINGLLATQAIFVFLVLAQFTHDERAMACLPLWAAATAGFLPFNFPRAKIFMGDVGSGVLGLLVALAVFWQFHSPAGSAFSGLIACSAFVTDATCTLLSRMLQGRRWYSAHREHLYQWLARSGFSHAGVVAWYMGWNFVVVLPVLYLINRDAIDPVDASVDMLRHGVAWLVAVYALAVIVWLFGKRWCLRHARMQNQKI
jgi:UDP-N-acetylmuramyl pentapeptide phosphotransferase/UDP-N-acetylglucosamine-1-phosphate transferase